MNYYNVTINMKDEIISSVLMEITLVTKAKHNIFECHRNKNGTTSKLPKERFQSGLDNFSNYFYGCNLDYSYKIFGYHGWNFQILIHECNFFLTPFPQKTELENNNTFDIAMIRT